MPEPRWEEKRIERSTLPPLETKSDEPIREFVDIQQEMLGAGWKIADQKTLERFEDPTWLKTHVRQHLSFALYQDTKKGSILNFVYVGPDIAKIPNSVSKKLEINRVYQVLPKNEGFEPVALKKIGTEWAHEMDEQETGFEDPALRETEVDAKGKTHTMLVPEEMLPPVKEDPEVPFYQENG